jgi:NIMA (never in mitosis gene a)-related kinase
MEYAEKGDLEKYLEMRKVEGKPLTEAQVIEWFIQLALGMKYIHEKKIVHRDLKADNIFITSAN